MRQVVQDYLETQDASLLDNMTSEEQRYVANQDPKAKKAAAKAVKEADAKAAKAAKEAAEEAQQDQGQ